MTQLVWDQVGDRVYQSGLDRGVLYLPDGSAVPWNGLTNVIEKFSNEVSPVYYDGMKISELVVLGDFSATMRAITYPPEFDELQGLGTLRDSIFVGDQHLKSFGLCYRTLVGDDVEGEAAGYKIHILYNVTAVPNDKAYQTLSNTPNPMLFEWNLVAVPEEVPGIRPTAHYIIDSRNLDPWLLEDIEEKLYGSTNAMASLIPMLDLVAFIREWLRIRITDNGDGTWTASAERPGLITSYDDDSWFQILQANAVYLSDEVYRISDTRDLNDVPAVKYIDNGNGTWTMVTDLEGIVTFGEDGYFEIANANAVFIGSTMYRVSDTK